jgi:uncharacterized protein (UPF0333 family)
VAKRAQTAEEYLIVLVVVVIIAVIVLAVMGVPVIKQDPALNFSKNFCLGRGYMPYKNITIYKETPIPSEPYLQITCLNISDGVVLHEDSYKVVYP